MTSVDLLGHGRPGSERAGAAGVAPRVRRRRRFLPAAAGLLAVLAISALPGLARAAMERVRFDATCDLARLRRALVEQVFRDGAETARAWDDETGCNHLTLSEPDVRVDPSGEQVVVRMRGEGRKSWQVGGFCSFPFDWTGSFALGIEPVVELSWRPETLRWRGRRACRRR